MSFYENPADDAEKTLSQIPSTITPYYQPYIDAGSQSLSALGNQYTNLLGNYNQLHSALTQMLMNPGGTLNTIGAGYEESPGYSWEVSQGQEAAENAADAGGYAGTPQDQQYQAQMTEGIADQDYDQWLNEVLGVGKTGLKGVGKMYGAGLNGVEGLNKMGYDASNQLAEGLAQYLNEQAGLEYTSQQNENQHKAGIASGIYGQLQQWLNPGAAHTATKASGGSSGSSSGGSDVAGAVTAIASLF